MAYLIILLLAAAWAYQFLALISLWRFFRTPPPAAPVGTGPGITVFKPLKGLEPQSRECLASFLTQAYQPYQVLFGVRDPDNPVLPLLRELCAAHPGCDAQIVICPDHLGLNPKISTLRQLLPRARYDLFVIADADVRVGSDYLAQVAAAFREPGLGLVSCPYRAGGSRTLGAAFEALVIAADFIPSVATAAAVEGIRFALGATMALTRQALDASGGLPPLADFLADDYQLGFRVARTGLQVKVLPYVVETHNPEMSLMAYLAHQLRWARTYRVCRPGGYLAYGITHALVFSLLLLGATGLAPWAWGAMFATLALRAVVAVFSEKLCLRGSLPLPAFALLPFKDLVAFGLWLASFLGSRVSWGGRAYRVTREGRLVPED
ncbi:MAG: bacteriohopanetetrol glucosamine biosynthesis glycosyltransferase HpnI [Syntrophobacterales bacterium]|jgi:ceramide glucosyltransferase|nr:bacteriohopanetetrol glucosamine biosynthesis glycosyltransferase HpnI [Syntrophobacterales bacterium]